MQHYNYLRFVSVIDSHNIVTANGSHKYIEINYHKFAF